MEAVGSLTGLQELKLNATAAIHMAPVAKLTGVTSVTLTVSSPPPLRHCLYPRPPLSTVTTRVPLTPM
jgi:hypothetical protein